MKKIVKIIMSMLLILLLAGSSFAYQGKGYGKNQGGQTYMLYDDTQVNHQIQIDSYPVEDLSQDEIDGLLLMREEEKLARDVYLELFDIWGQQIFSNIARSEETHTIAIKTLLDKYDLEDPMENDERGVFENENLQNLYDSLVEQGSESLVDALTVGATIEDLDIYDLQELNKISDNEDITAVYNNLEKGSRNHLRSFTRMLDRNGAEYEPQYISQEEYDEIISSDMETGMQYDSQGNYNQVNSTMGSHNTKGNQYIQNNQGQGSNNLNNPNSVYDQEQNQEQSRNMFTRMWRGVKGWFD